MMSLLQACGGYSKGPTQNDIIGSWRNPDGAEFVFNTDGTFSGKRIPTKLGFMTTDSLKNKKFNGSGKWVLRKGSTHWEVNVDFDKVDNGKNGCVFPLLISRENEVLENQPPWYLFIWEEEEGGERYKFSKH